MVSRRSFQSLRSWSIKIIRFSNSDSEKGDYNQVNTRCRQRGYFSSFQDAAYNFLLTHSITGPQLAKFYCQICWISCLNCFRLLNIPMITVSESHCVIYWSRFDKLAWPITLLLICNYFDALSFLKIININDYWFMRSNNLRKINSQNYDYKLGRGIDTKFS